MVTVIRYFTVIAKIPFKIEYRYRYRYRLNKISIPLSLPLFLSAVTGILPILLKEPNRPDQKRRRATADNFGLA